MRQIGEHDLDEGVRWIDRYNWRPVRTAVNPTTDGGVVVIQQLLVKNAGRPITLRLQWDQGDKLGWFSHADVLTLTAMAQTTNSYLFTWDNDSFLVVFQSVEFTPLQNWYESEEDVYNGVIILTGV